MGSTAETGTSTEAAARDRCEKQAETAKPPRSAGGGGGGRGCQGHGPRLLVGGRRAEGPADVSVCRREAARAAREQSEAQPSSRREVGHPGQQVIRQDGGGQPRGTPAGSAGHAAYPGTAPSARPASPAPGAGGPRTQGQRRCGGGGGGGGEGVGEKRGARNGTWHGPRTALQPAFLWRA